MSNVITETRDLSGFDRISLGGVGHLVVEPGDQESVKVEADSDLLPYIVTRVRDGRLEIRLAHKIFVPRSKSMGPINYYVTVKELRAIEVSGAGKVTGSGLCSDHMDLFISGAGKAKLDMTVAELDADISGAGSLRLAGEANRQKLTISGAGKYSARELAGKEGSVVISGTGKSTMNVSEKLDVKISGCGHVMYAGCPEISKRISGCGKVSSLQQ